MLLRTGENSDKSAPKKKQLWHFTGTFKIESEHIDYTIVIIITVASIPQYFERAFYFKPFALRKAKIVYNFGLSECNRV